MRSLRGTEGWERVRRSASRTTRRKFEKIKLPWVAREGSSSSPGSRDGQLRAPNLLHVTVTCTAPSGTQLAKKNKQEGHLPLGHVADNRPSTPDNSTVPSSLGSGAGQFGALDVRRLCPILCPPPIPTECYWISGLCREPQAGVALVAFGSNSSRSV